MTKYLAEPEVAPDSPFFYSHLMELSAGGTMANPPCASM